MRKQELKAQDTHIQEVLHLSKHTLPAWTLIEQEVYNSVSAHVCQCVCGCECVCVHQSLDSWKDVSLQKLSRA